MNVTLAPHANVARILGFGAIAFLRRVVAAARLTP